MGWGVRVHVDGTPGEYRAARLHEVGKERIGSKNSKSPVSGREKQNANLRLVTSETCKPVSK